MKKAPSGRFLLGAFVLSLAALFTACQSTPTRTAAKLKSLQGYWEGAGQNIGPQTNVSITITGSSLHYYRDTNFWYETTFTLPAGTDPQQLHATIKDCPPPADSIGKLVFAIFKIEDGILTLATFGNGNAVPLKSFEDEDISIYKLRKVQPQKKHAESQQTKVTMGETSLRQQITGSAWVLEPGMKHLAEIDKIASVSELCKAPIIFQNNSAGIRKVHWPDHIGVRQRFCELKPGENCDIGTFLTHSWVVTDDQGKALGLYYPDRQKRTVNLE